MRDLKAVRIAYDDSERVIWLRPPEAPLCIYLENRGFGTQKFAKLRFKHREISRQTYIQHMGAFGSLLIVGVKLDTISHRHKFNFDRSAQVRVASGSY